MTSNTIATIKTESSILHLTFEGNETWELTYAIIEQSYPYTIAEENKVHFRLYICYHNKIMQWIESTQGLALGKFMNIIPNEIRDKISP